MKVIVRHTKHKTLGTVAASSAHTMRTRPTPNADASKPAPEVWVGSPSPADDVRAMLPAKRRKNAVLALEYVLTASPEFFADAAEAQWRQYLQDQLTMLQDYYRAENVVSAVLHLDEKTPHLSVLIVPLVDGKLNARALIGTREACSIVQDMAGDVGREHGLERGKRGSKARHQDVQRFYADIEPAGRRVEAEAGALDLERAALAVEKRLLQVKADDLKAEAARLQLLAESLHPIEEERAARHLADASERHAEGVATVRDVAKQPVTARSATPTQAPRL